MSVIALRPIQEIRERAEKRNLWESRIKLLEVREHRCQRNEDYCERCNGLIMLGTKYVRKVYATYLGIHIFKYHAPVCPDDEPTPEGMDRCGFELWKRAA
jgi:hypothetical protein